MRPTGETRLGFKERRDTILEIGRNTKRCGVIGFRQDLSRRDDRTQPGVLTPGGDQKKDPPQRGGRIGRLEERQASKWNFGRIVCRPFPPSSLIPELWRTSRAGPKTGTNPGLKPRAESLSPFGTSPAVRYHTSGLSLIELLVVITIIALVSALITTSVLSALQQQNQRVCLNNMLTIEAAKDEYLRDHPGATSIPSIPDFQPYFRFGIPQCPDNAGTNYQNLLSLTQQVYCPKHPENQQKLSAAPSPAAN